MPLGAGEDVLKLAVRWHLCSDNKLVAMFAGMGGSGVNKPCFLCKWDRMSPWALVNTRSSAEIMQKSEWAQLWLSPLHNATSELAAQRRKAAVARKKKDAKALEQLPAAADNRPFLSAIASLSA